jgi:hypothetical protein
VLEKQEVTYNAEIIRLKDLIEQIEGEKESL